MQQLETFYESTPRPVGFVERKFELPVYTLNLHGPPRSGKSWLVLDHLSRIPKRRHLYVDLADPRVEQASLLASLQPFIDRHRIETVVLDHCHEAITPPRCRQTILVSRAPLKVHSLMPTLRLPTLDFEEYLAFERRSIHLEHSFSLYIKSGSLPEMAGVHESLLSPRLHERARALFCDPGDFRLFRALARFQGKPVSAHQLYTLLKKQGPISKDRVYRTLKTWEACEILRWVPRHTQPKAAPKALLFDFALPASLHFEKSLMGQLTSIAGRRLRERHEALYYTESLDFYLPEESRAVLLSPFANPQSAASRIGKTLAEIDRLGIRRVTVLTIANRFAFGFDDLEVEAVPFYEWMVGE